MHSVKLRKSTIKGRPCYSLTVPPEIATLLPEDVQYVPELTEDGILYRPAVVRSVDLPDWVRRCPLGIVT